MEDAYHLGVKALIRNDAGHILLLKVNPAKLKPGQNDYWDLPGGRVQKGQSVTETLEREVQEETGITGISDIQEIGMVLSTIRIPVSEDDSIGLILAIYSCVVPADAAIVISDEHISSKWYAPAEAGKLLAVKYPDHFCKLIESL